MKTTFPMLLPPSPREGYEVRHRRRMEFNGSRLIVVQAWAETAGVRVRVTGDNVVKFQCGPRAYATWVMSRGRLSTCTDWMAWPSSVRDLKVYTYVEVLHHLEVWLREVSLADT